MLEARPPSPPLRARGRWHASARWLNIVSRHIIRASRLHLSSQVQARLIGRPDSKSRRDYIGRCRPLDADATATTARVRPRRESDGTAAGAVRPELDLYALINQIVDQARE